jgi:UDP-N-acetylglucosamine 2-epimerase (non-hydrolysing)
MAKISGKSPFEKKKILMVFGTRPEAIKMCPLYLELKKSPSFDVRLCVSGQHDEMLQQVLDVFKVTPDYNLKIMQKGQDLFDIQERVMAGLKDVLLKEKPWLVLVHGDTSTSFVAALCAFYFHIPVGHVEAGLRTWNIEEPFPEEFNREAISLVAHYNFCPTENAKKNLIDEKKDPKSMIVTGNTGIDALRYTVSQGYHSELTDWLGSDRLWLLTAHRRENLPVLKPMLLAIKKALDETPHTKLIYAAHPNPIVTNTAHEVFDADPNAKVIPPLDVLDFHNLMAKSYLVLTDSGGIQEEAPYFGIPVLVMRNVTERPEGVAAGTLRLVGNEPEKIYQSITLLLQNKSEYEKMSKSSNPYGDGTASKKIVAFLEQQAKNA